MRLHIVQAFEGDSLIVETSDAPPRYLLIDGGPAEVFERHLQPALRQIVSSNVLDALVVSHVHADHTTGVLDLLAEIERADADGEARPVKIEDLWHNSFAEILDDDQRTLESSLQSMLAASGAAKVAMTDMAVSLLGIRDGVRLRRNAVRLKIALNRAFEGRLICLDELPSPSVQIGDVNILVVGPTDANLRALRKEWKEWLARHADDIAAGSIEAMANADETVPNLSSIVLYVRSQRSGRSMLLTGDARGDHIQQGIAAAGLLDAEGRLHLDLLKLQHHGSDRNVTREFFERITADVYVASADGKDGNPDYKPLAWIVEAAKLAARQIRIVVTNRTPSVEKLLGTHPPQQFGYSLHAIEPDAHSITVDLSAGGVATQASADVGSVL